MKKMEHEAHRSELGDGDELWRRSAGREEEDGVLSDSDGEARRKRAQAKRKRKVKLWARAEGRWCYVCGKILWRREVVGGGRGRGEERHGGFLGEIRAVRQLLDVQLLLMKRPSRQLRAHVRGNGEKVAARRRSRRWRRRICRAL